MATINYCAFIDVLGYGSLVKDSKLSIDQKVNILNSIYSNIAAQVSIIVNEINGHRYDKIFIRSFSDCFYLECLRPEPIIVACCRIFDWTFGFYRSFSLKQERTPLLRGGIVKDWTVRFKDIGSVANNTEELNPVGLGVARSYWTSEKSKLSGMRLIVSPEVIDDLHGIEDIDDFEFEFKGTDIVEDNIPIPYFFKRISVNEKNKPVNLFELVWTFQSMDNCTYDFIAQIEKLRPTFDEKSLRHFTATAQIILDGLRLSNCSSRTPTAYEKEVKRLERMINE